MTHGEPKPVMITWAELRLVPMTQDEPGPVLITWELGPVPMAQDELTPVLIIQDGLCGLS
jgi:hypothetical protein